MHGIFLDDAWLVGTDKEKIVALQAEYLGVLDRFCLDANQKKTVLPTAEGVEVIGMELHGRNLTLGLHPRKLLALVRKTRFFISEERCTGKQLASLIGSWSWAFLARRPFFAIFSAVYRFIEKADFRVFTIWHSVKAELKLAVKLAPLLFADLAAPWFDRMFAVDASSSGQGVVMTSVPPADLSSVATVPLPSGIELKDPVPHPITLDARWVEVVASQWRYPEHINLLEATSVGSALRRAASSPSAMGTHVMIWSDSMVVTGAIRKGRSSSFKLLARLRAHTALVLAMGFYVHLNWIPTDSNPADEPSRRFQYCDPLWRIFGAEFSSDSEGDGPAHSRFLCDAALKPETIKAYDYGLGLFQDWLADNALPFPSSVLELDERFCDFVHYFYLLKKGKCRAYVVNARCSLQRRVPGARGNLLFTNQALEGWKRLVPPKSYPPLTWKVTVVIAYALVIMGKLDFAIGVLLSFDAYLRVSELSNLLVSDVVLPGDSRLGPEPAVGMAQLHLENTKTGPHKWAAVTDPFVLALLSFQVAKCKAASRMRLFEFNEAAFRNLFRKVCKLLDLHDNFVPHSLRHGKATHDFLIGVPLETILVLGRWAAHKSARLYIQVGRAQLLAGKTPEWIANLATLLTASLAVSFSLADTALAEALSGCGL
jgi:integrase